MDARTATQSAIKHASELLGPDAQGFRLEEIERLPDTWSLTLSYFMLDESAALLKNLGIKTNPERLYKVFEINGNDGSLVSMKLRSV